nr:tetratricopeptide repeat protein [Solirubrobacterales bacterium]
NDTAQPTVPAQRDVGALTQRGNAELQRGRETGDPAHYERAEAAFRQALSRDRRDVDATVGLGTLAMNRHHFRTALRYAKAAHDLAPALVRPYPVLVDAQIELGRYTQAGRTLQRMVDLRPDLASYARVSFYRELHGDLDGAASAIRLAISAGGDVPENVAYVQSLLGHVEAVRGRRAAARDAYETALAGVDRYVPALVGLARLDAGAGRLETAVHQMRDVVRRQPLPEHVVALAELEALAGHAQLARRRFDAQRRTMSTTGSDEDVGLALLEADHGNPRRAVAVGHRAWRAAPSVHSADALGWALTRAGRPADGLRWGRRALKLGSRDPAFLARAGLSAAAAGREATARRYLRRSIARDPRFSAVWAPRVRNALRDLS